MAAEKTYPTIMAAEKTYPTIIGHIDTLMRLYDLRTEAATTGDPFPYLDTLQQRFFTPKQPEAGHVDYPRALAGTMAAAFFAIYVPAEQEVDCTDEEDTSPAPKSHPTISPIKNALAEDPGEERWYERYIAPPLAHTYAQRYTMTTMARLIQLESVAQGRLKVVRSATDVEECLRTGALAAIMHIEGAEGIDEHLDNLEVFYQAGLRSLGIVWSRPNVFGHGVPLVYNRTPEAGPGLTHAGKELLRACNRLGILVDLSHLNAQGFWDVARLSNAPLVATHSNAHTVCPSARNLTDQQLDAIKDSDGLVGVNFNVRDVRQDGIPDTDTPLEDIIRHVDYLVERIGIQRVALGTDYDGAMMPQVLSNVSRLPALFTALAQHGYDEPALSKLASENWLRILHQTWH